MEKLKKLIAMLLSTSIMLTAAGCQSKKTEDKEVTRNTSITTVEDLRNQLLQQFEVLASKYLKEESNNVEVIWTGSQTFEGKSTILFEVNVKDVKNIDGLNKFLTIFQSIYPISNLNIDAKTLSQLNIESPAIASLSINSKEKALVDLSNFEGITYLSLQNVNANNIPESVSAISFKGGIGKNGELDKTYNLTNELRQLKNLANLFNLSFEMVRVDEFDVPKTESVTIAFENCWGDTVIYVSDSNYVELHNNTEHSCNVVTVNGKINSKLNVVDYPGGSFVEGNINGTPEIQIVNDRPFAVPTAEDDIIYPCR
ncbi:MAG: hypothetical protein IJO33_05180 [Bacilli bacterium]|nr:hypothetical protein [Bacilli bacterium]